MKLISPWILCVAAALLPVTATFADATEGTSSEPEICHVCRVHEGEAEPETVVATAEYDGKTWGFCSVPCRDKFVEEPTPFVPPVFPRPAPSFEALKPDGSVFSSATFEGQWVLLDFWATWCPPCIDDLPKLTALHDRYAEKGFAVVSVSIDEGKGAAKKVARMIKRRKATHPVALDSEENPAWSAYGVQVVPMQFLINPEGQIVAQWSGKIDLADVEAEVSKALSE